MVWIVRAKPLHLTLLAALTLSACSSSPNTIQEAARQGNLETVKKFLDKDANLAKDANGPKRSTPLHSAKTGAIVDLLISKGADLNVQDQDGNLPLNVAQSADAAEALIKNGADATKPGGHLLPPLFTLEVPEVIPVLLAHGARINEGLPNQPFKTPLWSAVTYKRPAMTAGLIQNGAMATISTNYGDTYLHIAAEKNDPESIVSLIKGGLNPNVGTQTGETPLIRAVSRNALQAAEALLTNGADPNRTLTANVGMISLSMNHSDTSNDASGKTALSLASDPAMKELLQKHGGK